jgi:hypothetical protein
MNQYKSPVLNSLSLLSFIIKCLNSSHTIITWFIIIHHTITSESYELNQIIVFFKYQLEDEDSWQWQNQNGGMFSIHPFYIDLSEKFLPPSLDPEKCKILGKNVGYLCTFKGHRVFYSTARLSYTNLRKFTKKWCNLGCVGASSVWCTRVIESEGHLFLRCRFQVEIWDPTYTHIIGLGRFMSCLVLCLHC